MIKLKLNTNSSLNKLKLPSIQSLVDSRKCTQRKLCIVTLNHKIFCLGHKALLNVLLLTLDWPSFQMNHSICLLDVVLRDMLHLK